MNRVVPLAVLVVVAVAVGVIALSSGGGSTHAGKAAQSTGDAAPSTPATGKAAVGVGTTSLGKILVNADGRSLYLFEADKPDKSNCTGGCLSSWPPLTADEAPASTAALTGKFATIPTAGGKRQVTYNGHPLYLYAGDQKPGDTTGQGLDQFGAEWYVLSPAGSKIDEG